MCDHTKNDKIQEDYIWENIDVALVEDKITVVKIVLTCINKVIKNIS